MRRNVERLKVAEVIFDFRPLGDRKADPGEQRFDPGQGAIERVDASGVNARSAGSSVPISQTSAGAGKRSTNPARCASMRVARAFHGHLS